MFDSICLIRCLYKCFFFGGFLMLFGFGFLGFKGDHVSLFLDS